MKKIIAIILTVCLLFSSFALITSAVTTDRTSPTGRMVYFHGDYRFSDAYIFYWTSDEYGNDMIELDWPGVQMEEYEYNYGGAVFRFELPDDVTGFMISNGNDMSTVDVRCPGSVAVFLTDDEDDVGYIFVNVIQLDNEDPTQHESGENLVVLANRLDGMDGGAFADPLYICCRTDGVDATLYARMEYYDKNDYEENLYRFTVPQGTEYIYFTDGKKCTQEVSFNGKQLFFFTGTRDKNGLYNLDSAGADPINDLKTSHTIFDRFSEEYDYTPEKYPHYKELYTHRDGDKEDWILFVAQPAEVMDGNFRDLIGNRYVEHWTTDDAPIPSWYGIYDVEQDAFIPVDSSMLDDYDGLARVFDELGMGRLLGDLDGDDSITVIDATLIQRCEARMRNYPDDDEIFDDYLNTICKLDFFSDFNRDGVRDITDATAIQRYLAGKA